MIQYVSAHYVVEWLPDFPVHASEDDIFKIPTWQMFFNTVLNKLVSMDVLANTFISSDLWALSKLTGHLSVKIYRCKWLCHEKKKKGILVSSSFHACGGVFHSEYGTFSEGEL